MLKKNNYLPESEHFELKGFLSFLILHELNKKTLSGDKLSEEIGKRRGSDLTPGTIYPTLKKLRLKKLIRYKRSGRLKNYYLTEIGEEELEKLYKIFGNYFYGLKSKVLLKPLKSKENKIK
jgi:DNA-binding PadR family transcriptional regulator